jgi:ribose-phosphate pyrophosphokinase
MRTHHPDPADVVVISPDAGGVERARAVAKRLGCTLAIIDKRRTKPNVAEVMNLIGDVKGKSALILDDLVDTAGTLTQAARAVLEHGAKRVSAYAIHPVLSGPAITRVEESVLEELVVTNTIPLTDKARACKKIRTLSVSRVFGEAIRRIYSADSLSSLFV